MDFRSREMRQVASSPGQSPVEWPFLPRNSLPFACVPESIVRPCPCRVLAFNFGPTMLRESSQRSVHLKHSFCYTLKLSWNTATRQNIPTSVGNSHVGATRTYITCSPTQAVRTEVLSFPVAEENNFPFVLDCVNHYV